MIGMSRFGYHRQREAIVSMLDPMQSEMAQADPPFLLLAVPYSL
jgi:hypothetical protein